MMINRARVIRRWLLIAAVLNALGMACFYATARAHVPVSNQYIAVADSSYMLDAIGFTLMLPGIFFAAIAFLCARALTWSDETARVVWYASGFCINLIIAWRVGAGLATART